MKKINTEIAEEDFRGFKKIYCPVFSVPSVVEKVFCFRFYVQ
jgi:hypothetical protein